jgi:hypothetical protein
MKLLSALQQAAVGYRPADGVELFGVASSPTA